MRCNIFSLDINKLLSKGPEAAITTQIELKRYVTKSTNEIVYGFDLGYWSPKRNATPGTTLEPKYFLVLNAYEENYTVKDSIITDYSKNTGRRFLKIEDTNESEDTSGLMALFYLPPSNPDVSLRFLDEQKLKTSQDLLSTGFITKNNVVPKSYPSKSTYTFNSRISKPGILCVRFMEIYQFQYWDPTQHALHVVSFSFYPRDGMVIIDDDIKFKAGTDSTSYKPKSIETLRKMLTKKLENNRLRINVESLKRPDHLFKSLLDTLSFL